jgi:hypothetical protein
VALHDPSRHGDPGGGLRHMPDLAGVWMVYVDAKGEVLALTVVSNLCGLAVVAQVEIESKV